MWRNPFYCGVLSHNFLDNNPIEGNWDKMVSKRDFIRINEQLNNSPRSGYEQSKETHWKTITARFILWNLWNKNDRLCCPKKIPLL